MKEMCMSYEREGVRGTRGECDALEEENGAEQGWSSENLRGQWVARLQRQMEIVESLVSHLRMDKRTRARIEEQPVKEELHKSRQDSSV